MPLQVELDEHEVRQFCGVSGKTDPGDALLEWLYGDVVHATAREIFLGRILVQRLMHNVRKEKGLI